MKKKETVAKSTLRVLLRSPALVISGALLAGAITSSCEKDDPNPGQPRTAYEAIAIDILLLNIMEECHCWWGEEGFSSKQECIDAEYEDEREDIEALGLCAAEVWDEWEERVSSYYECVSEQIAQMIACGEGVDCAELEAAEQCDDQCWEDFEDWEEAEQCGDQCWEVVAVDECWDTFERGEEQCFEGHDEETLETFEDVVDDCVDQCTPECDYSACETCNSGVCESRCSAEQTCDGSGNCEGSTTDLTLEQLVVGAWWGRAVCNDHELEIGWFLCPAGRLRGFSRLDGGSFEVSYIDCGTWEVSGDDRITMEVTHRDTILGESHSDTWGGRLSGDTLYLGSCPLPTNRLEGAVDESDCTGGSCSAGGTGDIDCGTDCDCGRCWYCESGTCRYGGEGPYGCYRGCGV